MDKHKKKHPPQDLGQAKAGLSVRDFLVSESEHPESALSYDTPVKPPLTEDEILAFGAPRTTGLNEFKRGGVEYDTTAAYFAQFQEGLDKAFNTLINVTQKIKAGDKALISLQSALMDAVRQGTAMMAEAIIDESLDESDTQQAARRFNEAILKLLERYRGQASGATGPAQEYIPGAMQNDANLDAEKFNAGIFRKESDQFMQPSFTSGLITQAMRETPANLYEDET